MSINYVCGVFTSWKQLSSNNLILHFAINRFVGKDLIHYDLPSNNTNKANKKRVSLYIDIQTNEDLNKIDLNNIENITFVDNRFNNLIFKNAEYTLELSYTTKSYQLSTRVKGNNTVECYYFPMVPESITNISDSGTHLWTEDNLNTRKIVDIMEGLDIMNENIVRIPIHISSRTSAIII